MLKNRFVFFMTTLLFIFGIGNASFSEDEVENLIKTLKQDSPYFKMEAAKKLGKIKDIRAVEPLVTALKDDSLDVRWAASEALGEIGDKRAVEPLKQLLKQESLINIKNTITEALKKLTGENFSGDIIQSKEKPAATHSLSDSYPYNIEKVYEVIQDVLGSGIWYARNENKGVRYWGIKIFSEGKVEFELTAKGNSVTLVNISGPSSIQDTIAKKINQLGNKKETTSSPTSTQTKKLSFKKIGNDSVMITEGFIYEKGGFTSFPAQLSISDSRDGKVIASGTSGLTLDGTSTAYFPGAKWTFEKAGITFRNGDYIYTSKYKGAMIEFENEGVLLKGIEFRPVDSNQEDKNKTKKRKK